MQWHDEGIILALDRFGERQFIATCFCKQHGVRRGLLRQAGRHGRPYQLADVVTLSWRARHEDRLGTFTMESKRHAPLAMFAERKVLAMVQSALGMIRGFCGESEAHRGLYDGFDALLLSADQKTLWRSVYLRFEMLLLADIGYALDLKKCAVTGSYDNLLYVSPRTGHAVSIQGAVGYEHRMLPLTAGLRDPKMVDDDGLLIEALQVTGHFLEKAAGDMVAPKFLHARQAFTKLLQGSGS